MDFQLLAGDSWHANTPRKGHPLDRVSNVHHETSTCVACHPTHFTTQSALAAVRNGYKVEQPFALRFLTERLYNNPVPFHGHPEALWARMIPAPANVLGRLSTITMDFEDLVGGPPRDNTHRGIAEFLKLYYDGRDELPPDETNGNNPVSRYKVATDSWRQLDAMFAAHRRGPLRRDPRPRRQAAPDRRAGEHPRPGRADDRPLPGRPRPARRGDRGQRGAAPRAPAPRRPLVDEVRPQVNAPRCRPANPSTPWPWPACRRPPGRAQGDGRPPEGAGGVRRLARHQPLRAIPHALPRDAMGADGPVGSTPAPARRAGMAPSARSRRPCGPDRSRRSLRPGADLGRARAELQAAIVARWTMIDPWSGSPPARPSRGSAAIVRVPPGRTARRREQGRAARRGRGPPPDRQPPQCQSTAGRDAEQMQLVASLTAALRSPDDRARRGATRVFAAHFRDLSQELDLADALLDASTTPTRSSRCRRSRASGGGGTGGTT